MIPAEN